MYRKDDNFSYFGIWIDFVTTLNRLFGNNIWQLISKPFLPYFTRHFLVQSDTNKLFNSFIHKFRKQAILNEYLPHARLTRLFILFSLSLYSAYYLILLLPTRLSVCFSSLLCCFWKLNIQRIFCMFISLTIRTDREWAKFTVRNFL